MARHLCRDYLIQNFTTANRQYIYTYLLSIFMRRVLSYSYIGDTNFPINAVGTLLIATGDTTPTATPTFAAGRKAGINLGAQKEFYVSIPASVRTVTGSDIGRLLVLRSTANPAFNSGIFLIVGIEISTNAYIIDYRTLGDQPPVEAADSIQWWLYERDLNAPGQGAPNSIKASTEYRGDGNSTTPRIILQSPHSLGYQVRICNESTGDVATDLNARNCPVMSVSPGFGGNSAGDFPAFGQHFHAPQWFNSSSTIYLGGAPGLGDGGGNIQFRVTIVGDDTGQGVVMYCRRPGNFTEPSSNILCFGLPENEPSPLPVNNQARLFVLGSGFTGSDNFGSRSVNDGGLFAMPTSNSFFLSRGSSQGMGSTPFGTPCVISASMWTYVTGVVQGASSIFDASATDTPFTSSTELLPIDIMQATLDRWGAAASGQGSPVYPFAPKTIGTIPHLAEGRANFGDFSSTVDNARSYQHLRRGLYIPWNGPNLIP